MPAPADVTLNMDTISQIKLVIAGQQIKAMVGNIIQHMPKTFCGM
jgi:hypothetical protein